jgi:D-alanyl-D-alanine carboxypeptidase (penicillin-binding protein 5/6)
MRTVRRVSVALTVPLIAASLACPAEAVVVPEPVGGSLLSGHGVIEVATPGVPAAPKIDASSWIIADVDTGQVLAAKDPHGQYLPASALKTLTSITLIPKFNRSDLIQPSQQTCDVEGTKVGMTPKLKYRADDLFKAMLLMSANDAALAVASAGNGLKATLDAMNAEARRLQADDTLAASPNGLDVDLGLNLHTQHTSAYDLALFLKQGLKLPDFKEYISTVNAKFPIPVPAPKKGQKKSSTTTTNEPIYSHDRLLPGEPDAYRGMIGGKNGYTVHAGQTFVGAARRNGHTIVISLMHGEVLWESAVKLLDWGFAADGKVKPVGTLVDAVGTHQATATASPGSPGSAGAGAGTSAAAKPGTSMMVMVAGAGGGVILLAGILFLVRRRRTPAVDGPPPPVTVTSPPPPADSGPVTPETLPGDPPLVSFEPFGTPESFGAPDPGPAAPEDLPPWEQPDRK